MYIKSTIRTIAVAEQFVAPEWQRVPGHVRTSVYVLILSLPFLIKYFFGSEFLMHDDERDPIDWIQEHPLAVCLARLLSASLAG